VIKGDDKDVIEKKAAALAEASAAIAQQAYAQQNAPGPEAGAAGSGTQPGGAGDKGDVLDAEFEEVDKDKGRKD
jgi:molecular chaperone DnaK